MTDWLADWPTRNRRLVWRNGELVDPFANYATITSDSTAPTWFGIDLATGPDRRVVMERDSEGRWREVNGESTR